MRVSHFGNTANNAFYNSRLLDEHAGIGSELPIRMFGLEHAISAPAWEVVDFDPPNAEWVKHPDWSMFPEAVAVNARYTDLPVPASDSAAAPAAGGMQKIRDAALRRAAALRGARWAQPLFEFRDRRHFAAREVIAEPEDRINIMYGADSVAWLRQSESSTRMVCLEHGTIRWVGDGNRATRLFQDAYRAQLGKARHVWVTNLDPRTLDLAEELVPGRWSAFPHPFLFDPRVPFAESARRQDLLERTGSASLVLLPSSQNWSRTHDKGSAKALDAFVELRRTGADVGLVAAEWGLQVEESKAFLERSGVAAHVAWVAPMARFPLQRMMADVDLVWDQFGLDAFGSLALRVTEQGTPLISRGLTPAGERVIGGPVPWRPAVSTDDIVRETREVLDEIARDGRDRVMEDYRSRYRAWLLETHSPEVAVSLQLEVYRGILDGSWRSGSAAPDRWATMIAEGATS